MTDERSRLRHLGDMEVEAVVEMDRKKMKLSQAQCLQPGDVVALDKLAGEAFDVSINGAAFAKGEIVVVADRMACRLTRMVGPIKEGE